MAFTEEWLRSAPLFIGKTPGTRYINTLILAARARAAIDARNAVIASQADVVGLGAKTTQQEGISRPRNYGMNLLSGNIVESWTSLEDTWGPYIHPDGVVKMEVQNLIIDYGDGPDGGIEAGQIYINEQLIENVSDVEYQERRGTMNQTCMTGFEKKKKEIKVGQELLTADDPFVLTTIHNWADDVEFTMCFPDGLITRSKDNAPWTTTVQFLIEVSIKDADDWTTVFDGTMSDMTDQPCFKLYSINTLVPGTIVAGNLYDIRFTRVAPADAQPYLVNRSVVRSIREVRDVAYTRPGRCLLGIRAVVSSALTDLDVKVVRKGRIIATYDATGAETLEYSNDRSWVTFDVLSLPVISGDGTGPNPYKIERYEGEHPRYLDMDFFYDWSVFCNVEIDDGYGGTEPRCPCNISFSSPTKAMQIAEGIAAAGRANLYRKGNLLTGWIDDTVATAIDLVTMDAMMEKSWESDWAEPDEQSGAIDVAFSDANRGYEEDFAEYSDENAGSYRDIIRIPGIGLPTRGTAIHFGRFLLESERLILNTNKFKVAKAGFRYKPGRVIRLQCKPANWGAGFRVLSSTADTITVDRDAEADVTAGDAIYIRTYDTVAKAVVTELYVVDSVVGAIIKATTNWDPAPVLDNLVAVGTVGDIKLRRIIRIDSTQDNYFKVEVQTYDGELYVSDDYVPLHPDDAYNYPGITPSGMNPLPALPPVAPPPDVNEAATSNITWSLAAGTITWAKTDGDFDCTFIINGVSYAITPDDTTLKYVYWDPLSPNVFLATDDEDVAEGGGDHWIVKIQEDGVLLLSGPTRLIQTSALADNSVTNEADSYTAAKQAVPFNVPVAMATVADFQTSGCPVRVCLSFSVQSVGGDNLIGVQIRRTATTRYTNLEAVTLPEDEVKNFSITFIDEPDADTYDYSFWSAKEVNANVVSIFNLTLAVSEVKK